MRELDFPVTNKVFSGLLKKYKESGEPLVQIIPSSEPSDYPVSNILLFDDDASHWVSSLSEGLNANLVVKINNFPFYITHYTIRSHPQNLNYMQAWTLEGSNNGNNYQIIHNKTQNSELNNSGIGHYRVNARRLGFRYFRIKQTMVTVEKRSNMRISGLDFYGTFAPHQTIRCIRSNNRLNLMLTLVIAS